MREESLDESELMQAEIEVIGLTEEDILYFINVSNKMPDDKRL